MEDLKKEILKGRNLRPSTIKTYLFLLNKLHKKIFDGENIENLDFLKDTEKVIDALSDLKLTTQKTYLAAIVVALEAMKKKEYEKPTEKYRELMIDNIKEYNTQIKEQAKSETQRENWVSMKQLKKVVSDYKKQLTDRGTFTKEKDDLTKREKDLLQKWLTGSLYVIDNENPPLRLDYTPLEIISLSEYNKMSDEDLEKNNYLVNATRNKKFFSFGNYKTSGTYGTKKIPVGNKLNSVLNLYLRLHESKWLILNSKDEPMSPNGLGKYLTKVFEPTGKKVTANLLRHVYISEFMTGPSLKEKEELGEKMGHGVSQQELYRKE